MAKDKGLIIPESASTKVVVYTTDEPYSRGNPGYLADRQFGPDDDVQFTTDLWMAMARPRDEWARWLPYYKGRTRKNLLTHGAAAVLISADLQGKLS